MYKKVMGVIFILIGLYILGGAIFSFSNPDYPTKKAIFTGGIQLIIAIFPLILGVKIFRKRVVINQKDDENDKKVSQ